MKNHPGQQVVALDIWQADLEDHGLSQLRIAVLAEFVNGRALGIAGI